MSNTVSLVLVNGPPDSVQAPRARMLFGEQTRIVYKEHGRLGSIRAIRSALNDVREGWIYCIDLGIPGAPLAAIRRARRPRVRLAYELGDPARPLLANQARPAIQVALADFLDRRLPVRADRLVVRGSYLIDYFQGLTRRPLPPCLWLPDGVDPTVFRPRRHDPEVAALRQKHGLEGKFVVGVVGSIHHNPVHNLFYGWELAEVLAKIPAKSAIVGVVVGDGPGRPVLEATRDRLGLGDRLSLVGRVPHQDVPLWMNVFDVGLSTQTDNPVGWGRTTAKLPEYLACGLPLVCTDVGEAHRWLAESGQTLAYRGMRDDTYPARLAERLQALASTNMEPMQRQNRELALRLFDYAVVRGQLGQFLAKEPRPGK